MEKQPTATPPRASRGRLRRTFWRVFRVGALAYLGFSAILFFAQEWLIFPGRASQGRADAQVTPPPDAELVPLTAAGQATVGLFGPALAANGEPLDDAAERPTLLYFYGNYTWLSETLAVFEDFRRLGVNVLIPEYLGYGLAEGRASERNCVATAEAAYDYLLGRSDQDPGRIVVAGSSLGGAVAIDLASRRPAAGLAVFATFTSADDMRRRRFPFTPPGMLRHPFRSEQKIALVTDPVLICHGTDDSMIPSWMADRLAVASGGITRLVLVEGGEHDSVLYADDRRALQALADFLDWLERRR